MTGKTHLAIGILTGVAIARAMNAESGMIVIASMSAGIGALLPDIDTPRSIISQLIFPLSFIFRLLKVAHRGLTHSIPALLVIAGLCHKLYLERPDLELHLAVFVAGYISHLIADMLTPAGISIFYPLPIKLKLVPAIISRFTAPVLDKLIFAGCLVGILVLIFSVDLPVIIGYLQG